MNTHLIFKKRLSKSRYPVALIAKWLTMKGYSVRIPPESDAENKSEWQIHADRGDLFIEKRVEVKHRQFDFSCKADYPYGTAIVCAVSAWDRMIIKPDIILIVNKEITHIGIIKNESKEHWTMERIKDPDYGSEQLCYMCPLRFVEFMEMEL